MSATIIVSDKDNQRVGGYMYGNSRGGYLKCRETKDTTSRVEFTVTNPCGDMVGSFFYPLVHDLNRRDATLVAQFCSSSVYKFSGYTSTVLVGHITLKPQVAQVERENAQLVIYVEKLDRTYFSAYFYIGEGSWENATASIGDATFALSKKGAFAKASRFTGDLLILAMLEGSALKVNAGKITDTYTLTGFAESLNYIKNNWGLDA